MHQRNKEESGTGGGGGGGVFCIQMNCCHRCYDMYPPLNKYATHTSITAIVCAR